MCTCAYTSKVIQCIFAIKIHEHFIPHNNIGCVPMYMYTRIYANIKLHVKILLYVYIYVYIHTYLHTRIYLRSVLFR